jgi:N-acetylglutamate synthase-like GNAT family acetyltransferase
MREEIRLQIAPMIRKATAADARDIRALIWRVGINPVSLDWRRFLVAVNAEDRVIGTGQIKPHGDGTREMASIAVQPEHQGEGVGKAIIQRLLAENELPLYLTCQARMEPYYHKFGFLALKPVEMPPYFRRIFWLASFLSWTWPRIGKMRVMIKTS